MTAPAQLKSIGGETREETLTLAGSLKTAPSGAVLSERSRKEARMARLTVVVETVDPIDLREWEAFGDALVVELKFLAQPGAVFAGKDANGVRQEGRTPQVTFSVQTEGGE